MNNMTLPIPNQYEWITVRLAAARLKISTRTVRRMMETGVLTAYRPIGFTGEKPPVMLWSPEVDVVRNARTALTARG